MALANELVYKGQLLAGSPQVEAAQLVLPQPDTLQQVGRQAKICWWAFVAEWY